MDSTLLRLYEERSSLHEGIWAAAEMLHPSGCAKAQMSLCSHSKLKKLFMSNVCCAWSRMDVHSLYSYFIEAVRFLKWMNKGGIRQKIENRRGEVGVNPRCQRHFVFRHGSIIPTKVPLTCLVAPRGPAVTDPCSCCLSDGRRSCPNESSWSPQWNPCSRYGNINNKIYSINTLMHSYSKPCHRSFTTRRHGAQKRSESKVWARTFSKLLTQHMHKHLYIARFLVVFYSVFTQQRYSRSSYSQEDVCQIRETILQTHQQESVGLDINIKYH